MHKWPVLKNVFSDDTAEQSTKEAAAKVGEAVALEETRSDHTEAMRHLDEEKRRLQSLHQQFDEFQKELDEEVPPQLSGPMLVIQ